MNTSDAVSSIENTMIILTSIKVRLEDNDTYDFDIESKMNSIADTADEIRDYIDEELG